MTSPLKINRALISVSDKTGIEVFAKQLDQLGVEIVSTGGTANLLAKAGIKVQEVASVTGFPEIMDGRVKTLHPKIHAGLLANKSNSEHLNALKEHDIEPFDLICVNLYPFLDTLEKTDDFDILIENIDIGGPAMLRASAKNHESIVVVTDSKDYELILSEIKQGGVSLKTRRKCALKTFSHTASYDSAISSWLSGVISNVYGDDDAVECQAGDIAFGGVKGERLRYGENPHQDAFVYKSQPARSGVLSANILQGKALSYNNLNDADAAFELVSEFSDQSKPAIAIIKHANPCGVSEADTLLEAWQRALRCDPVSAFGGIIAANCEIDEESAHEIASLFTEVIIAPKISPAAKNIFAAKKNLRVLETGSLADPEQKGQIVKSIAGGLLVQSRDHGVFSMLSPKVVTKKQPTDQQWQDLEFAWKVAKHVKSNAIIYAKDRATVGIGAGQMSRVDSTRIAASKAKFATQQANLDSLLTQGSVVASDAFFPFADGVLTVIEAGATAIIQPGGSMRDDEVIKAADEAGIAMVFTGMRHFRH